MTVRQADRMHPYTVKPRRLLISLLSPTGLALISYAFFSICIVIPPRVYEAVMSESDRMFLDPAAYLFVTVCVLSFGVGILLTRRLSFDHGLSRPIRALSRSAILLPLIAATSISLLSLSILLQNNPNLLLGWFIDAAEVKRNLDTTGALTQALPLQFALCWWGLWRLMERETALGRPDKTLRLILGGALLLAVATAVMKVARYNLMPGLFGVILIYLTFKSKNMRMSAKKILTFLVLALLILLGLFLLFSWLRGSEGQFIIFRNLIGYTAASYNRLPAILNGDIQFPYGGSGTYAFRFLGDTPLLHRWIDLGLPKSVDVWRSEFPAVAKAGLDKRYIWSSAFGYVYSDLGWFTTLYFFFIGAVATPLWRGLIKGRAASILLYPWFAFSILFWFGSNLVAYPNIVTLTGAAILISFYERAIKRTGKIKIIAYPLSSPYHIP